MLFVGRFGGPFGRCGHSSRWFPVAEAPPLRCSIDLLSGLCSRDLSD